MIVYDYSLKKGLCVYFKLLLWGAGLQPAP